MSCEEKPRKRPRVGLAGPADDPPESSQGAGHGPVGIPSYWSSSRAASMCRTSSAGTQPSNRVDAAANSHIPSELGQPLAQPDGNDPGQTASQSSRASSSQLSSQQGANHLSDGAGVLVDPASSPETEPSQPAAESSLPAPELNELQRQAAYCDVRRPCCIIAGKACMLLSGRCTVAAF